jgi:hypothetical protein
MYERVVEYENGFVKKNYCNAYVSRFAYVGACFFCIGYGRVVVCPNA